MILGSRKNIIQVEILGANTDSTATVTTVIDMMRVVNGVITFYVIPKTGTHLVHVVTLQYSPDGSTWRDGSNKITGTGCVDVTVTAARYIRLKVTTAEGGLSTSDIYLLAR